MLLSSWVCVLLLFTCFFASQPQNMEGPMVSPHSRCLNLFFSSSFGAQPLSSHSSWPLHITMENSFLSSSFHLLSSLLLFFLPFCHPRNFSFYVPFVGLQRFLKWVKKSEIWGCSLHMSHVSLMTFPKSSSLPPASEAPVSCKRGSGMTWDTEC